MRGKAWGRVQLFSVCLLLMVMQGCCQWREGRRRPAGRGWEYSPGLAIREAAETERQRGCAHRVVTRLARRDGLSDYVVSQEVQLEPGYRIRVSFRFRHDMQKILPRLGRFWKFPSWIGGGRYASSYGRGQPGFEIHLDPEDPSRTVGLNAPKSSDVDDHEPAGDVASIVLHGINVVQHAAGSREKAPCDLLADMPEPQEEVPTAIVVATQAAD